MHILQNHYDHILQSHDNIYIFCNIYDHVSVGNETSVSGGLYDLLVFAWVPYFPFNQSTAVCPTSTAALTAAASAASGSVTATTTAET